MSADDAWIAGMVAEASRRGAEHVEQQVDSVLANIPALYHDVLRSLVLVAVSEGQAACFEVLREQGWLRPELEESA